MVLFRCLSDRVLLRVHSERFLFESSVIGSSSGSSAIDSSLGSSVLFFRHDASFFQNVLLLFLLLKHILFYIIFSKRTSHLTISSEKNAEILAWYRHEISNLYWKYILSISQFINYLYCWIYCMKNRIKFFRNQTGFCFILKHKEIYFICSHSFSFLVPLLIIRCHPLLFVIPFVCLFING